MNKTNLKSTRDEARKLVRERILAANDPTPESEAMTRLAGALSAGEAILKHDDFNTLSKSEHAAFAWSACNLLKDLFQLGEETLGRFAPKVAVSRSRAAAPAIRSRAEISQMTPTAQSKFFAAGGKIN